MTLHNKMKARLILLLLLLSVLLSACNGGTNGADTTTPQETTTATAESIKISEYKIIRPEHGEKTEIDAAVLLRNTLSEVFSLNIPIDSDWIKPGESHDAEAKEILVGNTNYEETATAAAELRGKDYVITISGPKIVIVGGSPGATYSAVQYFCENYLAKEGEGVILTSMEPYTMKYDYKYESLDIRVASLNLLTANNPLKNQQAEREPRIVKFVQDFKPYSLGVQECEVFWRMRLDLVLEGYERAQEITTVTKNYIYYRTDKLKVVDSGVFWLSETPEQSSKGFGSSYYISCCWAIFESLENGSRYVHMNTHLDVNSEETRKMELTVLLPRVKQFMDEGYAVVVTGDFNSHENSIIYQSVTEIGLTSARYLAKETSSLPTFNGFREDRKNYSGPIDYIFLNDLISVAKYDVIDKYDGGFLSDHNALYADIKLYK